MQKKMNIKSLSQYRSELQEITQRSGLSGNVTNYLINVLAYSLYQDMMNKMTLINESDPDKAMNINSQIDYAIQRLYSVYRGRNNIVTLNLKALSAKSVNKYDIMMSGKGWNMYAMDSITSLTQDSTFTLECMIAPALNEIDAEVDNIHTYYVDFPVSNVSENYELLSSDITGNEEYNVTPAGTSVSDLIDLATPVQVTYYDYGLRIYFRDAIESTQRFRLRYFEYDPRDMTLDDFSKINIPGFEVMDLQLSHYIERAGIDSGIGTLAKKNLIIQTRVRSITDLTDAFDQMFFTKSLASNFELEGDTIVLYYIPKDPENLITDDELAEFKTRFQYYINNEVKLEVATSRNYYADITVYSSTPLDKDAIYALFDNESYKLGSSINRFQLIAQINATDPNIIYNELTMSNPELAQIDSFQLGANEYAIFNVSTLIVKIQ